MEIQAAEGAATLYSGAESGTFVEVHHAVRGRELWPSMLLSAAHWRLMDESGEVAEDMQRVLGHFRGMVAYNRAAAV